MPAAGGSGSRAYPFYAPVEVRDRTEVSIAHGFGVPTAASPGPLAVECGSDQCECTRLRDARVSRGMTQADLASQAHVRVSYIWKLESGGAAPGIDLVDRLAAALGTTAAEMPATTPPDTAVVLREQARRLFESWIAEADRDDLVALNPILARFNRGR
jgi:transcriptional regulator with XRE-family HTH domain